jgi:hypothetical protein
VRRPTVLEQHLAAQGDARPVTPADALHAARRHFLRGERLDMNELAQELGIGRATLYRWVGSRDQLLGEVIWSLAAPGLAQARTEAEGRGAAWVLAIYRRFGDLIIEFDQQRRVVDAFRDILVEAQERKGLQLRLDPETLAFALVRIGESFLWTDLITGEAPDLTKAHEVAGMLLT